MGGTYSLDLCKVQADDSNQKQTDYYFFSRKDKKYPTGNRANRATAAGFWKATGRDKPIHTKLQQLIGMRKTLVFYEGRAPHGIKTEWIMHEFRLDDGPGMPAQVSSANPSSSFFFFVFFFVFFSPILSILLSLQMDEQT